MSNSQNERKWTDDDVAKTAKKLTPAKIRNLMALPSRPGNAMTISEMDDTASGSGMTLLYTMGFRSVTQMVTREWTKWHTSKAEGITGGEGYEYGITEFGVAVRDYVKENFKA